MKIAIFIYIVSFLTLPIPRANALGTVWSGNSWMVICGQGEYSGNKRNDNLDSTCEAYTEGVISGLAFGISYAKKGTPPLWCGSSRHTVGQLVRVIMKYMNNHPEYHHTAIPILIKYALSEAFPVPCSKNPS